MGDHTESLQVDFDSAQISLEQIVDVFWRGHSPIHPARSPQYMAAIWFANQEQQAVMNDAKRARGEELSAPIQTPVLPLGAFFRAEDYHQKYKLQRKRPLLKVFNELYPNFCDFVDSTAAAKLNGDGLSEAATMTNKELSQYGVLADEVKRAASGTGWDWSSSV